jgi:hypothetical protein
MSNQVTPGVLRRWISALGGAIKRGALGKSSHQYMKQFSGGDVYWDAIVPPHHGRQQPQAVPANADAAPASGRVAAPTAPAAREQGACH